MPRALKSTAKLWPQSKTPGTKYRDRKRVTFPDGERKEMYGYGPTKQAATDDLYAKVDAATQQVEQAETITVTQLFAEFMQHKRSVKGSKDLTIHGDLGMFRRHIQPQIGETPIADLHLGQLQGVQYALTSKGKWRTAELATILLKGLLNYAAKRYRADVSAGRLHLVSRDDFDNIKRPQGVTRQAGELWTPDQVNAFLALSRTRYESQKQCTVYPLFYTALAAGLRRGELLGLGRKALRRVSVKGEPRYFLDITEQLIDYAGKLHHDTPKSESGVRRVPVSDVLAAVLHTHMVRMDALADEQGRAPSELMFPSSVGTPLMARTVYRARDTLITDLGLPKSTLHQMRKVYTSYLTRDLVKHGRYSPKLVAKLLGHSDHSVALDVYTLVIDEDYMDTFFEPVTVSPEVVGDDL